MPPGYPPTSPVTNPPLVCAYTSRVGRLAKDPWLFIPSFVHHQRSSRKPSRSQAFSSRLRNLGPKDVHSVEAARRAKSSNAPDST
ncbi:hypothetical protein PIB30_061667 [Stylosanthes scabra]|uniref:Uncharacterized protein n=1 Tax=Stylosanthes scabra TaxID=79078 RepID=A0ABU6UJZ6_9FABA|nr:hypothetical protein [Stylosanthes scabra]